MNGGGFVVLIVALVMFMVVMKARYRYLERRDSADMLADSTETTRLEDEVKALKARIHVLERIAVDKENTLAREIEQLRDPGSSDRG